MITLYQKHLDFFIFYLKNLEIYFVLIFYLNVKLGLFYEFESENHYILDNCL